MGMPQGMRCSPSWVERLSRLPGNQPFTTAMARDVGLGRHALQRLTAAGDLRRLLAGVYVGAAAPDSIELRCRALGLILPSDAFVCDRTASWLYAGARALAPNEHLSVPPISCFRPSEAGRLRNKLTVSGERAVESRDLTVVHGIAVTTPLRTAVDLGRLEPSRDLRLHGMDVMLGLGVSHQELLAEVPRFKGQRGVVLVRTLAPLADGGAESFGETALRLRWHDAGLPRPQTQIRIMMNGVEVHRLDLGLEEHLFAAEYDGEEWHGPDRTEHDQSRRSWLTEHRRWLIESFDKSGVFGRDQDAEQRLRTAYARAKATLGERTFII